MLTLDKVYHASYVLKDVIRETSVIQAPNINKEADIYLKTENLQITGSFKVRGAYYKISQLSDEEKAKGVIACSAGNHAQGVALAATANGIKSLICLPDGAPISKVEATKGYGADVCLVKGVYDDAYAKAMELKDEMGYTFIHPFDDIDVIAGQGTIGLEILNQLSDVDAVIVPIGGGGLISGVAFAIKSLRPQCKVYGVQAEGAPSMYRSVKSNEIHSLDSVKTIADGIAVKTPGDNTFELCSKYVDEIVTVSDDEVASAILALMEQQKLVSEGAGAVSVAAAMFNKVDIKGKKVCCLVSGGNIDVTILSRVISRGLLSSGRSLSIKIELTDKPGQLEQVSKIIAGLGGNIVSIYHDRYDLNIDIVSCILDLRIETRDFDHINEIVSKLKDEGFKIVE
jgi:threonine dehydratase